MPALPTLALLWVLFARCTGNLIPAIQNAEAGGSVELQVLKNTRKNSLPDTHHGA